MASITANKSIAPSSTASAGASTSANGPAANVQEFNIRVPKNLRKKHHVMRFNATLNVDFAQWRGVKMERENNMKEFRGMDEYFPKFGAGSEYNRDLREEVRRKKFGIIAKKYRPEAQPWILKVGGKIGKKFKGIREGGVSENAAFYVFTHAPDGAIEAYPLHEWYNFQPIQRYKSLSAEEAEHEFGRRKKVLNYFSLMLRKRLKGEDEGDNDPEEAKLKGGTGAGAKKSKELKISEMDEWIDSEDESDSDSDDEAKKKKAEDSDDGGGKAKKGKGAAGKGNKAKKKKKHDVDDEAFEESDDGDEEGREMDYDTESSEDEPDPESKLDKDMKSVAEEDALRKLLTSDEEEEEEKKSDESEKEDEEKERKKKDKDKNKDETSKDGNKKKHKKHAKDEKKAADSSSDFTTDSSDSEEEPSTSSAKRKPGKDNLKTSQSNQSRSGTPIAASTVTTNNESNNNKRKANNMPSDLTASDNSNSPMGTPAKRKTEMAPVLSLPSTFAGVMSSSSKDDFGITEEAVRRYLMRKPMTATELLTKFKNKKNGVSSERLVETMTQILKKINPVKQTIQGKMYLSIKVNKG